MKTDHARFGLYEIILNLSLALSLSLVLTGCTGNTVLSAYLETNRTRLDQPVTPRPGPPSLSSSSASPRELSPRTWRTPG